MVQLRQTTVLGLALTALLGARAAPLRQPVPGTTLDRRVKQSALHVDLDESANLSVNVADAISFGVQAGGSSSFKDVGNTHPTTKNKSKKGGKKLKLNESKLARFGSKTTRGINIGSWLILENWQTPSLFLQPDIADKNILDEWSWLTTLGKSNETAARLDEHFSTWITRDDFVQIKELGLNTVRLPVPFWAFAEYNASEPYISGVQLPHIANALGWARDLNLDVVLDLHGVPGSQNGYDNSGRAGSIGFGSSQTNADIAIDALVKMVNMYVNEPVFGGVVKAIEPVNEPKVGEGEVPLDFLHDFYRRSYREILGAVDQEKAPVIPTVLFSDAFLDPTEWLAFFADDMFLEGTIALDTHSYQAWEPLKSLSYDGHVQHACSLSGMLSATEKQVPVVVGEFSIGIDTRCVPYQRCGGVTMADDVWTLNRDSQNQFARRFWEAQSTTFEQAGSGWIFWSWKGESTAAWSFKDAVQQGWIPRNLSERAFPPSNGSATCVSKQPAFPLQFATRQDG